MKKEIFITSTILVVLGMCFLMLNGCSSDKEIYEIYLDEMKDVDKNAEEGYVINQMGKLKENSDCLSCIGCVNMKKGCFANTGYLGCIDCFGVTVGEDTTAAEFFSEKKIFGGVCGSSCLSCYWVNVPMLNSDGHFQPAYGCLRGE